MLTKHSIFCLIPLEKLTFDMCGIIGAFGHLDNYSEKDLRCIHHRGPDDSGTYHADNLFLGHVRLAIQDVSELGHQPMISEDGRYCLVFNGEIYNHIQLRKVLRRSSSDFKSSSDTETLLYGLIETGDEFIRLLNGIFAFAFYDSLKQELLLARDPFGVKPLYYFLNERLFVFSSELKAITPFLETKTIDIDSIKDYLSFLWCPGEGTPLKQVKKLLPGYHIRLSFNGDNKTVMHSWTQFYRVPFNGVYLSNRESEVVELLDEKLTSAVRSQLLSDVPVGFFLSGGLDSSLLVAIARKITGRKLQCFTIASDVDSSEEGFENDLSYAKRVASHLDVDLDIIRADINVVRDFDSMIWHLDEPQADAAPLNVSNISKRARQLGYKVLIGGTAGDDLFSGYRRHQAIALEPYLKIIPLWLRVFFSKLNVGASNAFARRINKIVKEIAKEPAERLASYYVWLPNERVNSLINGEYQGSSEYTPISYFFNLLNDIPKEESWLNRMLYWEMRSFLVDHNLNYTDKMGMANGVEIRVPFLDLDVVKFACQISPALKLRGRETKYILKKVAERYLPKEVIYRSKTGFGAPVRTWILNDLDDLISQRLLMPSPYNAIFNLAEVHRLVSDNKTGKIDASYSIWGLLAVESWIRQFLLANGQSN